MSDADADAGAPWIRLAGAILLAFGILALVADVSFLVLLERIEQVQQASESGMYDPDHFEQRERTYRLLDIMSSANLSAMVFGGWCMALALAAACVSTPRLRPLVGLTALAYAVSTAYWARWLAFQFSDEQPRELEALTGWLLTSEIGQLAATGGAAAIVLLRTRGAPRRGAALAGAAVGLAAALLRLLVVPHGQDESPPSWWLEPVLGLRVGAWVLLAGTVGLGLGLWLAATPTGDRERERFDAAAARALRLARRVVWWRLALAVGSVFLMIAAASAARRAQHHALTVGGSGSSSISWMLELTPWIGLVEIALSMLMAVALGAAVLQHRSRLAAALTGTGAVVLLGVTVGSHALDMALYEAMRSNMPGLGWGGGGVRDYAELATETQPTLRWLGLLGMATTLAGLVVLARVTGRGSPLRAIRMVVIAVVFTAGWLHGQEALDDLGALVLLLIPLLLAAAIWMLLDLVTFLREVAEGLDPAPPDREAPPR